MSMQNVAPNEVAAQWLLSHRRKLLNEWGQEVSRILWHLDPSLIGPRGELRRMVLQIHDCIVQTHLLQQSSEPVAEEEGLLAGKIADMPLAWGDLSTCFKVLERLVMKYLCEMPEGGELASYQYAAHINEFLLRIASLRLHKSEAKEIALRDSEVVRRHRLMRFLSNASHDARAPLTTLLGFTELLQEETYGPLNEAQQTALGHIYHASLHLQEILDNLFDLLRVQDERRELHPRLFDLNVSLREIVAMLKPLAQRQGVQLESDLDSPLPWIIADESLVRHIVYQMILGSLRSSRKEGSVRLNAQVTEQELTILVKDSAAPVPQQKLSAIYGLSVEQEPNGVGGLEWDFGLSLACRYIELHQGRLEVKADEDHGGNVFLIRIPVRVHSAYDAELESNQP
ncbi:MAG TPA: HAMP domain-containing sensor histidine kinase [Chthonomonas sp.]|uniref:sensor histidine kinase n=1 Tax=Chthonomonas sp. TaxID=2282153 RepID=UPI002B4B6EF2|nr:HAMP domain-containing sensor histidine kinase [Chthonomonas sp.]HLI48950.1 HAMP domain-containing sensor histidine kinase [Chthonomonas sp.]